MKTALFSLIVAALMASLGGGVAQAEETMPHAGMLRYPDVSATHIVFGYANGLWLAPRTGGAASPLASPPGQDLFPRFSPDGKTIVFQGNYEGNRDLYTIPIDGGVAARLTHHPAVEFPTDWTPDGRVLFFMNGLAGLSRQTQLFTVSAEGGAPEQLPVPYGANGAISADGKWLAYTPHSRDFRTWKRYRGGMATDIWLFNLESYESRRITDWEGTDTFPMWHGKKVYYLSDSGSAHRLNIWAYDSATGEREQITKFSDYDVKFPAMGPGADGQGEIILQSGPQLFLLDLKTGATTAVEIRIPGSKPKIRERVVDAGENIQGGGISATGKRAVVEARGDIFTVPAEKGPVRRITDSSGAADRSPAWSPDGRWIAYFSDADGEYELYVAQSDGKGEARQLTDGSKTFYFSAVWSPDSKTLAITDKAGAIILVGAESGEMKTIDRDAWANQPNVSWSGDSRWLTYAKTLPNGLTSAVFLFDTDNDEKHRATSGFFRDYNPVFSRKGDYIYYASNRDFTSPEYEDVGSTFVYAQTGKLIAVPLTNDVEYPWGIESDEETWDNEADGDDDEQDEGDDEAEEDDDDDEDSDDDNAEPASPIHGVWEGVAHGLSQVGLPDDDLEFTMTIIAHEDGSFTGASTSLGQTEDYDAVTFDEKSGAFTAMRSREGVTTKLTGKLEGGDKLSGTWEILEMDVSGAWDATKTDEKPDAEAVGDSSKKSDEPVEIEIEGFESRGMEVPVDSGSFFSLASNDKGQLLYVRAGNGAPPAIKLVDVTNEKPEEKTVIAGVGGFDVSADGKKLLVAQGDRYGIISAAAGQSIGTPLRTELDKRINPREEWKQIFTDAWRRHRDFFYVSNMHGVDWDEMRRRYSAMLEDASSREDVSFIIGEMIAELNVGHAYYFGGDVESQPSKNVGMLGTDFELVRDRGDRGETVSAYKIMRIYNGAPWDSDARGPLSQPGIDVDEGDYLIAVNGVRMDTSQDPWAAFVGMAGQDTTITVASALSGDEEARNEREITIKPMSSEVGLRYRAWVEDNRRRVEKMSDGKIGYIYVPNTGIQGQNELFRQFYGQIGKEALLIDERWNGGGQIPDRFIELLNRPRTNYWARRDGKDWPWPYDSHQGPKAMLINGLAGSGGDMFPWLFKHNGLGKLIGMRTWGGLVGISGNPPLIDGGYTAVPTFGFYETDGTWGIEGHGVDPDIQVIDDPTALAKGEDPQLEAGVEHLLGEIQRNGYKPPKRPSAPDRSGMGVRNEDK